MADYGTKFYDAQDDMTEENQKRVMGHLSKVDLEEACMCLRTYLSNPNSLTKEGARDSLLHTSQVLQFYENNYGDDMLRDREKALKFIECLKKLANYSAILLKPKQMRPDNLWETIMTNSPVFEEYVGCFQSHELVLEALGYGLIGLTYKYQNKRASTPSPHTIKEICSDLLVLRAFMEVKLGVKMPKYVALPDRSEVKRTAPLKSPDANSVCDICNQPASFYCDDKSCQGKAWCVTCNDKWHVNNSKRSQHNYIAIPNAKSANKPASDHQTIPSAVTPPSHARRPASIAYENVLRASSQADKPQPPIPAVRPTPAPRRAPSTTSVVEMERAVPVQRSASVQKPALAKKPVLAQRPVSVKQPEMASRPAPARQPSSPRQVSSARKPETASRPTSARPSVARQPVSVCQPVSETQPAVELVNNTAGGSTPAYKQEMIELEQLVTKMLPSSDINLFEQRISSLKRAMDELRLLLQQQPPNSTMKGQYSAQLIGMNKQRSRLEERLEELESQKKRSEKARFKASKKVVAPSYVEEEEPFTTPVYDIYDASSPASTLGVPSPLTYLKVVSEAEAAGYNIQEIIMGLKNSPFKDLLDWLRNIYVLILDELMAAVGRSQSKAKLSRGEVKKAMIAYGQDHLLDCNQLDSQAILQLAQRYRDDVVTTLLDFYSFTDSDSDGSFFQPVDVITEEMVGETLLAADGDVDETQRLLDDKVAEKVREYIWSPLDEADLDTLGDGKQLVRKQVLNVIEDEKVERQTKMMLAMAELHLTHVQADELLFLMDKIYQKEDRVFELKDAILAVTSGGSRAGRLHEHAVSYLSNPCTACLDQYPRHDMANLPCHDTAEADMGCCKSCAAQHFKVLIENDPVSKFVCPARCGAPGSEISPDQQRVHEFFEGILTVVFPNVNMAPELVQKFNEKLAVWQVSTDPNFHWCINPECSKDGYGFIDEGNQKRLACHRCGTAIKCRSCEKPWSEEHENRTCEEFATWLRENTEEYRDGVNQRDQFLEEYGIQCPKCKQIFQLAKGGCMDCDCPTCKFKFCNGCGTQLYSKDCPQNAMLDCEKLGLHGHHPRNCHNYLRDYSTDELKGLLKKNDVPVDEGKHGENCQQMLENDNNEPFQCNEKEVENSMCIRHYTEYLTALINKNKLEVLPLMDVNQLKMVLRRGGREVPEQERMSDEDYSKQLIIDIETNVPLQDLSAFKLY